MPSLSWSDLQHHAHDRGLVVAGVTKDAMLADFQSAIDDVISKGMPYEGWTDKAGKYHKGFLDHFDDIVKRYGWDHTGGRDWRARIIYQTNIDTAYAAGRYKQMTDPVTLKVFPYWRYVHAHRRVPVNPREKHEAWDGLVLRADDPFWLTHYPPNDWKCSCGVENLSQSDLELLGKSGPDKAPRVEFEKRRDPATGEWMDYPKGVGMGWAYTPGRSWADGLVPQSLQKPLADFDLIDTPKDLMALSDIAEASSKAVLLDEGQDDEFYISRFLAPFGASIGTPHLFRDRSGHAIPISDDLFRAVNGEMKIKKSNRERAVEFLAETIIDPDEIWIDWAKNPEGKIYMVRRYVRYFTQVAGFASFSWTNIGWHGQTVFDPKRSNAKRPDFKYLEKHRKGALLYRRKKEIE